MTNWEKYKDKLQEFSLDASGLREFLVRHGFEWTANQLLNTVNFHLWCEKEANEEVDWNNVEKGTKILVAESECGNYYERYFYLYDPELKSPFITCEGNNVINWKYAKLPE